MRRDAGGIISRDGQWVEISPGKQMQDGNGASASTSPIVLCAMVSCHRDCHVGYATDKLHPLSSRRSALYLVLTLISAAAMTSIFQKLTRPFTSATLRFAPEQTAKMDVPEGAQKCTIAAGCFWGVEHMYRKDFGNKGLLDARVGYIGGDSKSPSYRAVCSGTTGRE